VCYCVQYASVTSVSQAATTAAWCVLLLHIASVSTLQLTAVTDILCMHRLHTFVVVIQDETIRLLHAYQFVAKHGEVSTAYTNT
jgi:hypothetical protein